MNYIKVKGLSKSYSEIKALKNLSMEIEAGTLFGILGPNGAGKSTLIKILATLIEPDSGEVLINNINLIKNSRKIRELIGYVAQDIALDKILTGRELLDFQAEDGIRDVLQSRGLGDVYKRQPLSGSIKVASIFIRVDLPAPFGPSIPNNLSLIHI